MGIQRVLYDMYSCIGKFAIHDAVEHHRRVWMCASCTHDNDAIALVHSNVCATSSALRVFTLNRPNPLSFRSFIEPVPTRD